MSAFLFCWPDGDVSRPAQKLVKARWLCLLYHSGHVDWTTARRGACRVVTKAVHVIKLVQVGGAGLAIIDKADAGPQFGAEGLSIALQPGRERTAKSRLGSYYAKRADGGRSLFAPGEEKGAQLTDLKVRVPGQRAHAWTYVLACAACLADDVAEGHELVCPALFLSGSPK